MDRLASWLEEFGPLGLFLAAALDSFVPLAHVVDPMVVYLSHASNDPVSFALLATAGSVLGTTTLFLMVRAGGDAFVSRRMSDDLRRRVEFLLERYGLVAVIVGGILPPPFPFKAVVFASALARMRLRAFVTGVLIARLLRYGLESTLAAWVLGPAALDFMKHNYAYIGAGFLVLTVCVWLLTQRLLRIHPSEVAPDEPSA